MRENVPYIPYRSLLLSTIVLNDTVEVVWPAVLIIQLIINKPLYLSFAK